MTLEEAVQILKSIESVPSKSLDGAALATALPLVADHLRQTRTELSSRGVDGAPDWFGYEHALWQWSELLRPKIAARKDWRTGSEVIRAIASICADHRHGKGRQNFVLILGRCGGPEEAETIVNLLGDPDVQGHAIKALTQLRDGRGHEVVAGLLPGLKRGWVSAAAKKYLEKAEGWQG